LSADDCQEVEQMLFTSNRQILLSTVTERKIIT